MKTITIVLEGFEGDKDTTLEFSAEAIEVDNNSTKSHGRPRVQVLAKRVTTTKVSGVIHPDSIISRIVGSGRVKKLSSAQAKLERPTAFAVRMRLIREGHKEMRTYTAASGNLYHAENGFPTHLHIITTEAEAEELRQFDQFEVVEIATESGEVDGQITALFDEIERLINHADAIREDPECAIEVLRNAQQKADLFTRLLRGMADRIEDKVNQARSALSSEITGGTNGRAKAEDPV